MSVFSRVTIGLFCLLLALTACGVRFEVEPTSQNSQPVPVGIGANSNRALRRVVASPRFVFLKGQPAQTQLFMATRAMDVLLVRNHGMQSAVNYDAVWFAGAQGGAKIALTVYTRRSADQDWKVFKTEEIELRQSVPPATVTDSLGVEISPDMIGEIQVRAEVEITTIGESVPEKASLEFKVYVLSNPGIIKTDPKTLQPSGAKLDASKPLVDYRAWIDGPCTLLGVTTGDPSHTEIDKSCQALKVNNPAEALKAAQRAISTTQSLEIKARLYDMIGIAQINLGNIAEAIMALTNAAQSWGALDRIWQVAISLHNLAVAAAMGGDTHTAVMLLTQVQELHSQIDDEPGRMTTWANLGYLSGSVDLLREAHTYFERSELPQSAITAIWLSQLKARP